MKARHLSRWVRVVGRRKLPRCCRSSGSRSGLNLVVDGGRSATLVLTFRLCSAVNEGCAANGARREVPLLELKRMGFLREVGGRAQNFSKNT